MLDGLSQGLSFDDVLLIPAYSEISSRSKVSLKSEVVRGVFLDFPIMSAAMDTVTEWEMAVAMDNFGGIGVIHRYMTLEQQLGQVSKFFAENSSGKVAVAIGVVDDYLERAQELTNAGVTFLSIDVAHGDHLSVHSALRKIKTTLSIPVMVGNVATPTATLRLCDNGADGVKLGIGPGAGCTTRVEAGVGYPQLSAIYRCAGVTDVPCCADGGIKHSGDVAKALAAGANSVMCGRILAGTKETPMETMNIDGGEYKLFRGLASEEAKLDNGMPSRNIEGISMKVPYNNGVVKILERVKDGVQSGFSYVGCDNISDFQKNARFVRVSPLDSHISKL